jgi:hypothetical protein
MPDRLYPDEWESILNGFLPQYSDPIKTEYDSIYDHRKKALEDSIKDDHQRNNYNLIEHNILLSNVLCPFIKGMIPNYALLLIDIFFDLKLELNLSKTFDFLIGKIINNQIVKLIFGEVKSGKPTELVEEKDILKIVTGDKIHAKLIECLTNKNPALIIDFAKIQYEFVAITNSGKNSEFKKSINDRKLPYILWSEVKTIKNNITFYSYVISENILKDPIKINEYNKININLEHLDNDFSDKFNNLITSGQNLFEFTASLDQFYILKCIYEEYIVNFDSKIDLGTLKDIIQKLGFSAYYTSEKLIEFIIKKVFDNGILISLIREENKEHFWKKRIDFDQQLFNYRFNEKLKSKIGMEILDGAIQTVKPVKKNTTLDQFFGSKKTAKK